MAAKLGTGSEAYAPLARAIIGGLAVSVVLTLFIVPAAYYMVYRRKEPQFARRRNNPRSGTGMSQLQEVMNQPSFKTLAVGLLALGCVLGRAQEPVSLTLQQAHEIALRNHPLISVADLKALAAKQVTREVQSAFFPNLWANVMSVGTAHEEGTRLGAIGGLNNPLILQRNAEGVNLTQLITDFGRTANLSGSAKLRAKAEADNARATREQILLAVDGAFYGALRAQAITHVAEQTVATHGNRFSTRVSGAPRPTNFARTSMSASPAWICKAAGLF